jgi:diguanylate cyclase (GGDEF)-like protein
VVPLDVLTRALRQRLARGRLARWLLGSDAKQRLRLVQCSVALLLGTCSALNMAYLAAAGIADPLAVSAWATVLIGGYLGFFIMIRGGGNMAFDEPSLTVPQMLFGIVCGAAAYAIAGAGRGGAFPILMVIFMFGMYALTARQIWRVGVFAVLLMGATMGAMSVWRPEVFAPEVEMSHFIMIAVMVPAVALLTGQLSRMRERLRRQKKDIAVALARIQDLATRDELTGLINRRHMLELMEQERQRGVRSGQTFCIALISLDDHAAVEATRGPEAADQLLRGFAQEALPVIRISDLLARWRGAEFLLMLSDTRSSLARLSVERLRERMRRLAGDAAVPGHAGFSVGVSEHRAGETVAQTVERAEIALQNAQSSTSGHVVLG